MPSDNKRSASGSCSFFSRKGKFLTAAVTVITFVATSLWVPAASAAAVAPEANLPYQIKLDTNLRFAVPQELGKVEDLRIGKNGQPAVVHIQTAHGHYQAQQQIRQILHHLSKNYGVNTVFVEGSAFKLEPEVLNFFPKDPKLTMKINDELAKHALVKGPELFLLDELQQKKPEGGGRRADGASSFSPSALRHPSSEPAAEAYGIEDVEKYRSNGAAFVDVLTQKEKTAQFLADMNEGIERLSAPYLNDALRNFLKRQEAFEKNLMPMDAWFSYVKEAAQKHLKLDLANVAAQIEWPMMVRVFQVRELSAKLDGKAFPKERDEFLSAIRRFMPEGGWRMADGASSFSPSAIRPPSSYAQIEQLLKSEQMSQQLPDPETSMLFENMVKALPRDFNYGKFPNVRLFIGLLLLQSELKAPILMSENAKLTDLITAKLARTEEEKKLIGLLKDHLLLQKLFALELMPGDYDGIGRRKAEGGEGLKPSSIVKRFENAIHHPPSAIQRVKAVTFAHIDGLDRLYDSALEFYKGVKARDGAMLEMVEKRLKETGADKVAVITGGFHSGPFQDYFSSKDYTYALISPKIAGADKQGYQAYITNVLTTTEGGGRKADGASSLSPSSILHPPSLVQKSTREFAFTSLARNELREMGVDPVALARAELRAGMPAIEKLADKQAFAVRLKELAGVETPRLGRSEARLKKTGASFSGVAFKARGPQEWLDEVEGIAERSSDLGRSVRRAKGAPQSLKNKIEGVGDIRVQMEILFARIQKETTRIAEEADGASAGLARQQRSLRDMTREMEALYNKTIGIARSIAGRSEVRDIEDLMLSLGISKDEEVANVLFWIMMGKMNQGAGKVDPAISELVGKFNVDQEWTERERSRSLELIRKNSQYIPAEMFSSEDATLPYAEWAVQPAQTADLSGMSDASRSEARLAQIPGEAKGSSARSENRSVDGPASGGEVRGNKPRHEETGYLEGRVRFEGGLQLAYTGLKWDVSRNGKFLRRFSVNHPEFKEISVQPGFGIFILFNNAALFVGDDGALEKIDLKYGFDKLYMNEGVGCAIETSHEVVFVSLKGKVSSHKLEGQLWVTPASVLKVLPGMGFLVGGNGHVYLINKDGKERFDPYKMGKLYNWAEELDESSAFIEGVGWVGVFEHGVVIISADGTAKIMKYQKESLVLTRLQARRGVGFLMEFQREYWFIDQSLQVFKSSSKDELIKEHPEVSTFYEAAGIEGRSEARGVYETRRAALDQMGKERAFVPLLGFAAVKLYNAEHKKQITIEDAATQPDTQAAVLAWAIKKYGASTIPAMMDLSAEHEAVILANLSPEKRAEWTASGRIHTVNGKETLIDLHALTASPQLHMTLSAVGIDWRTLKDVDPATTGRLRMPVETLKKMDEKVGRTVPKIAYSIAPYTLAAFLMGDNEAMLAMMDREEGIRDDEGVKMFDAVFHYSERLIAANVGRMISEGGADIVVFLDPRPTGMVSPEQFLKYSVDPVNRLSRKVRQLGALSAAHPCRPQSPEDAEKKLPFMIHYDVDILSVDSIYLLPEVYDAVEEANLYERKPVILGNMDTLSILPHEDPKVVKHDAQWIFRIMGKRPFIFCSSCDIDTTPANMHAFASAAAHEAKRFRSETRSFQEAVFSGFTALGAALAEKTIPSKSVTSRSEARSGEGLTLAEVKTSIKAGLEGLARMNPDLYVVHFSLMIQNRRSDLAPLYFEKIDGHARQIGESVVALDQIDNSLRGSGSTVFDVSLVRNSSSEFSFVVRGRSETRSVPSINDLKDTVRLQRAMYPDIWNDVAVDYDEGDLSLRAVFPSAWDKKAHKELRAMMERILGRFENRFPDHKGHLSETVQDISGVSQTVMQLRFSRAEARETEPWLGDEQSSEEALEAVSAQHEMAGLKSPLSGWRYISRRTALQKDDLVRRGRSEYLVAGFEEGGDKVILLPWFNGKGKAALRIFNRVNLNGSEYLPQTVPAAETWAGKRSELRDVLVALSAIGGIAVVAAIVANAGSRIKDHIEMGDAERLYPRATADIRKRIEAALAADPAYSGFVVERILWRKMDRDLLDSLETLLSTGRTTILSESARFVPDPRGFIFLADNQAARDQGNRAGGGALTADRAHENASRTRVTLDVFSHSPRSEVRAADAPMLGARSAAATRAGVSRPGEGLEIVRDLRRDMAASFPYIDLAPRRAALPGDLTLTKIVRELFNDLLALEMTLERDKASNWRNELQSIFRDARDLLGLIAKGSSSENQLARLMGILRNGEIRLEQSRSETRGEKQTTPSRFATGQADYRPQTTAKALSLQSQVSSLKSEKGRSEARGAAAQAKIVEQLKASKKILALVKEYDLNFHFAEKVMKGTYPWIRFEVAKDGLARAIVREVGAYNLRSLKTEQLRSILAELNKSFSNIELTAQECFSAEGRKVDFSFENGIAGLAASVHVLARSETRVTTTELESRLRIVRDDLSGKPMGVRASVLYAHADKAKWLLEDSRLKGSALEKAQWRKAALKFLAAVKRNLAIEQKATGAEFERALRGEGLREIPGSGTSPLVRSSQQALEWAARTRRGQAELANRVAQVNAAESQYSDGTRVLAEGAARSEARALDAAGKAAWSAVKPFVDLSWRIAAGIGIVKFFIPVFSAVAEVAVVAAILLLIGAIPGFTLVALVGICATGVTALELLKDFIKRGGIAGWRERRMLAPLRGRFVAPSDGSRDSNERSGDSGEKLYPGPGGTMLDYPSMVKAGVILQSREDAEGPAADAPAGKRSEARDLQGEIAAAEKEWGAELFRQKELLEFLRTKFNAEVAKGAGPIFTERAVKQNEARMGLTPVGVRLLRAMGVQNEIFVESGSGINRFVEGTEGVYYTDDDYQTAGATVLPANEFYAKAAATDKKTVISIKEPQPVEFKLFTPGTRLFTYVHLADDKELTENLQASVSEALAYETVSYLESGVRKTPLLAPASKAAGWLSALRYAVSEDAKAKGITNEKQLNGLFRHYARAYPNTPGELRQALKGQKAVVLGGGVAGENAAFPMAEMGAEVTVTEVNLSRIAELERLIKEKGLSGRVHVLQRPDPAKSRALSGPILEKLNEANAIIGAILVEGAKAPVEVPMDLYKRLAASGNLKFIGDIAVDQGGNIAATKARLYRDGWPADEYGVSQFTVTNMPSMLPLQVSYGIEAAKIAYLVAWLMGTETAVKAFPELEYGFNIYHGNITHPGVAKAHDLPYVSFEDAARRSEARQADFALEGAGNVDMLKLFGSAAVAGFAERLATNRLTRKELIGLFFFDPAGRPTWKWVKTPESFERFKEEARNKVGQYAQAPYPIGGIAEDAWTDLTGRSTVGGALEALRTGAANIQKAIDDGKAIHFGDLVVLKKAFQYESALQRLIAQGEALRGKTGEKTAARSEARNVEERLKRFPNAVKWLEDAVAKRAQEQVADLRVKNPRGELSYNIFWNNIPDENLLQIEQYLKGRLDLSLRVAPDGDDVQIKWTTKLFSMMPRTQTWNGSIEISVSLAQQRSEARGFADLAKQALAQGWISESALANIQSWSGPEYARVRKKLDEEFKAAGEDPKAWSKINDAWYTKVAVGTAGMRGTLGLGTNRINEYTIGSLMLAHALAVNDPEYTRIIEENYPEFRAKGLNRAVVIGGDSRYGSYDTATKEPGRHIKLEALINAALGIKAYVFKSPTSTPQLAWAAHELDVEPSDLIVSGSMNTASHNPKTDNGNKPYKIDGSQSTGLFSALMAKHVPAANAAALGSLTYDGLNVLDHIDEAFERAVAKGDIRWVGGADDDSYAGDAYHADELFVQRELQEAIHTVNGIFDSSRLDLKNAKISISPVSGLSLHNLNAKIVISPLYGVSRHILKKIIKARGLSDDQIIWVEDDPNSEFPGVEGGKPNPEEPKARLGALRKAVEENADLVLWTDPDADRPAVAAKKDLKKKAVSTDDYVSFNGNQQLAILMDYLVRELKALAAEESLADDVTRTHLARQAAVIMANISKTFAAFSIVSADLPKIIARDAGMEVVETLVGFKYIGDQIELRSKTIQKLAGITETQWQGLSNLQKLELALAHSQAFIFGGEESLGALSSDGPHDKDALAGVMWFVEIMGRLRKDGRTLNDRLTEIYQTYGYFSERFPMLEKGKKYAGVELSEAEAMDVIKGDKGPSIMGYFRTTPPKTIAGKKIIAVLDYDAQTAKDTDGNLLFDGNSQSGFITAQTPGIPEAFRKALGKIGVYSFRHQAVPGSNAAAEKLPKEKFVRFILEDGSIVTPRPSGTEPKLKFYILGRGSYEDRAAVDAWVDAAAKELDGLGDVIAKQRFPEKFSAGSAATAAKAPADKRSESRVEPLEAAAELKLTDISADLARNEGDLSGQMSNFLSLLPGQDLRTWNASRPLFIQCQSGTVYRFDLDVKKENGGLLSVRIGVTTDRTGEQQGTEVALYEFRMNYNNGAEPFALAEYSFDSSPENGHGPAIEVAPEYQHRNIGTALVQLGLYVAKKYGQSRFVVREVGPVAFYEDKNIGFVRTAKDSPELVFDLSAALPALSKIDVREAVKVNLLQLVDKWKSSFAKFRGEENREYGYKLSLNRLGSVQAMLAVFQDPEVKDERTRELIAKVMAFGQGSVFRFWNGLSAEQKRDLLNQLRMIDRVDIRSHVGMDHVGIEMMEALYQKFGVRKEAGLQVAPAPGSISAPAVVELSDETSEKAHDAKKRGQRLLRDGQVAVLELAGGTGSRLGYAHPKIMFNASPVLGKSLGRMRAGEILAQAEAVAREARREGHAIPWIIMTSDVTHEETVAYLNDPKRMVNGKYFGLIPKEWVKVKQQRVLPIITHDGEWVLESEGRISVGGFGHGDARDWVMQDPETQKWLKDSFGIRYVVVANVDNALLPGLTDKALGYHEQATEKAPAGVERLSKIVVEKRGPEEKVGVAVLLDGKDALLEYNQFGRDILPFKYAYEVQGHVVVVYRSDDGTYHLYSLGDFGEQIRNSQEISAMDNKTFEKWISAHLMDFGKIQAGVPIEWNGQVYTDKSKLNAKLWLRLGSINAVIWSLDPFADQNRPLPALPVVVDAGKKVEGFDPESGKYRKQDGDKDGRIPSMKFETMLFHGFVNGESRGAHILADRVEAFAPIKDKTGNDSPESAARIFSERDARLLNETLDWNVSPSAVVEINPAQRGEIAQTLGRNGVLGEKSRFYLGGSRGVRIGDNFHVVNNAAFILRVADVYGEGTKVEIGDHVTVQKNLWLRLAGRGNVTIEPGTVFDYPISIELKDGEWLHVEKGVLQDIQERLKTAGGDESVARYYTDLVGQHKLDRAFLVRKLVDSVVTNEPDFSDLRKNALAAQQKINDFEASLSRQSRSELRDAPETFGDGLILTTALLAGILKKLETIELSRWNDERNSSLDAVESFLNAAEKAVAGTGMERDLRYEKLIEVLHGVQVAVAVPFLADDEPRANLLSDRLTKLWFKAGDELEQPRMHMIRQTVETAFGAPIDEAGMKKRMQAAQLVTDPGSGTTMIRDLSPEKWSEYPEDRILSTYLSQKILKELILGLDIHVNQLEEMVIPETVGVVRIDKLLRNISGKSPDQRLAALVKLEGDVRKDPKAALELMKKLGALKDGEKADVMGFAEFMADLLRAFILLKTAENWKIKRPLYLAEESEMKEILKNLGLEGLGLQDLALRLVWLNIPLRVIERVSEGQSDTLSEYEKMGDQIFRQGGVSPLLMAGGKASRWFSSLEPMINAGILDARDVPKDLPRALAAYWVGGYSSGGYTGVRLSMVNLLTMSKQGYPAEVDYVLSPHTWRTFMRATYDQIRHQRVAQPGRVRVRAFAQNTSRAWELKNGNITEIPENVLGHGDVMGVILGVIDSLRDGKVFFIPRSADGPLAHLGQAQLRRLLGFMAEKTVSHIGIGNWRNIGQSGGGFVSVDGQPDIVDTAISKEQNTKGFLADRDIAIFSTFINVLNGATMLYAVSKDLKVGDRPLLSWDDTVAVSKMEPAALKGLSKRLGDLSPEQTALIVKRFMGLLSSEYVEKSEHGKKLVQWEQVSGMWHGAIEKAIRERQQAEGVQWQAPLSYANVDISLREYQVLSARGIRDLVPMFAEVKAAPDLLAFQPLVQEGLRTLALQGLLSDDVEKMLAADQLSSETIAQVRNMLEWKNQAGDVLKMYRDQVAQGRTAQASLLTRLLGSFKEESAPESNLYKSASWVLEEINLSASRSEIRADRNEQPKPEAAGEDFFSNMDIFGPDATLRSARSAVKVQAALERLNEVSREHRRDLSDPARSDRSEIRSESRPVSRAEARMDLHRLVNTEILILMREYYHGVAPWRVQTGLMGQLTKGEEALKALLQAAGITMPSAIANKPETDVLAQFFPAEERLEIPETAVLRAVAASGAARKTNAAKVGGPVYASAGLFNRLVDDNPSALFFLLSAFHNIALQTKAASPVLETAGAVNLPGRIRDALSNKKAGITNDAERQAILKDLDSFLKINPLEAGQSEAAVLNGRIAALNGRMATLHLDDALLPMLEGGVNVAIGERVGDEDLLLAVGLAVQLTLFSGATAEALLKQMQDRGIEMKARGAYSLVLSHVAQLGEELVHAALIARSA